MAQRHDTSPKALVAARRRQAAVTRKKGDGLTKRVRAAIDLIVFGDEARPEDVITLKTAAERSGLSDRALRMALNKPAVLSFYRKQLQTFREAQRARNLHVAVEVRDSATLKDSAAGAAQRLAAARQLDADLLEHRPGQPLVSVSVNMAGYVIDLSEDERKQDGVIEHHPNEHVAEALPAEQGGDVDA